MIFEALEQQFESLLEEKSRKYPNSSDYLRHSLLRLMTSQIELMLAHLRTEKEFKIETGSFVATFALSIKA